MTTATRRCARSSRSMRVIAVQTAGRHRITLVWVAVAVSALLTACGDKKDKPATQTAAKVNKEEITVHQINAVLQQQRGLKPEQTD